MWTKLLNRVCTGWTITTWCLASRSDISSFLIRVSNNSRWRVCSVWTTSWYILHKKKNRCDSARSGRERFFVGSERRSAGTGAFHLRRAPCCLLYPVRWNVPVYRANLHRIFDWNRSVCHRSWSAFRKWARSKSELRLVMMTVIRAKPRGTSDALVRGLLHANLLLSLTTPGCREPRAKIALSWVPKLSAPWIFECDDYVTTATKIKNCQMPGDWLIADWWLLWRGGLNEYVVVYLASTEYGIRSKENGGAHHNCPSRQRRRHKKYGCGEHNLHLSNPHHGSVETGKGDCRSRIPSRVARFLRRDMEKPNGRTDPTRTAKTTAQGWDRRCGASSSHKPLSWLLIMHTKAHGLPYYVQFSVDRQTAECDICTDETVGRPPRATTCTSFGCTSFCTPVNGLLLTLETICLRRDWPQRKIVIVLDCVTATLPCTSHSHKSRFSLNNLQIVVETESVAHSGVGSKTGNLPEMPDVHTTHEFHQWYTELDARKKAEWDEKYR